MGYSVGGLVGLLEYENSQKNLKRVVENLKVVVENLKEAVENLKVAVVVVVEKNHQVAC